METEDLCISIAIILRFPQKAQNAINFANERVFFRVHMHADYFKTSSVLSSRAGDDVRDKNVDVNTETQRELTADVRIHIFLVFLNISFNLSFFSKIYRLLR